MVVTYDSKNLISICSTTTDSFEVHGYNLTTFKRTFKLAFKGELYGSNNEIISETFLKVDNIEQNSSGTAFAIGY